MHQSLCINSTFLGPFATNAPGGGIPDVIKAQLEQEDWYHGAVSRDAAERLLKNVNIIPLKNTE